MTNRPALPGFWMEMRQRWQDRAPPVEADSGLPAMPELVPPPVCACPR